MRLEIGKGAQWGRRDRKRLAELLWGMIDASAEPNAEVGSNTHRHVTLEVADCEPESNDEGISVLYKELYNMAKDRCVIFSVEGSDTCPGTPLRGHFYGDYEAMFPICNGKVSVPVEPFSGVDLVGAHLVSQLLTAWQLAFYTESTAFDDQDLWAITQRPSDLAEDGEGKDE